MRQYPAHARNGCDGAPRDGMFPECASCSRPLPATRFQMGPGMGQLSKGWETPDSGPPGAGHQDLGRAEVGSSRTHVSRELMLALGRDYNCILQVRASLFFSTRWRRRLAPSARTPRLLLEILGPESLLQSRARDRSRRVPPTGGILALVGESERLSIRHPDRSTGTKAVFEVV